MKKFKLLCIFLSLVMLSSCAAQNTELKYRLVISGIGIDYADGLFELTVQVLSSSSDTSDEEKNQTANYFSSGKTVAQAMNALIESTGKYPLYSQNRIIVLGNSITGETVSAALNFFVREYTSRPDVFVAAASGSARDILTAESGGEVTAKLIEDAIEKCSVNALASATELYDTVNLSLENTTCFTLPLLEVTNERSAQGGKVKVTGTLCHKKTGEAPTLSAEETTAFLFITNKVKNGNLSINSGDKNISLEVIKSKTKTKITSEKPEITIEIKCEADVVEFGGSSFEGFSENDVDKIEESATAYIKAITETLIERMTKKEKCDIFRFGTRLEQKFGSDYTRNRKNYIEELKVEIKTEVTVNRIGQMNVKK